MFCSSKRSSANKLLERWPCSLATESSVTSGQTAFQDVEAGKEMTTDTLFRIASMSKPVTSVAVMSPG